MDRTKLIAFYTGDGRDARGRTIDEIWGFSLQDLERVHDYIQWLFPLTERSAFNPDAPLLDEATIARFRADPPLRARLERSLDVMLGFYGFVRAGDRIERGAKFVERARNWLTPHNHNFLRLTRILASLTLLGLGDHAIALLDTLEDIYREHPTIIGETTLSYWRRAAG